MSAPTTANSDTEVVITWPEPNSNGADILEYLIEIQTDDGDFIEEDTYCDGAANTVRSLRTCSIPMTVLTDVPFSLTQGITIKARVSSKNAQGFSNPSPTNSVGAIAQRIPHPPPEKPLRVDASTDTHRSLLRCLKSLGCTLVTRTSTHTLSSGMRAQALPTPTWLETLSSALTEPSPFQ